MDQSPSRPRPPAAPAGGALAPRCAGRERPEGRGGRGDPRPRPAWGAMERVGLGASRAAPDPSPHPERAKNGVEGTVTPAGLCCPPPFFGEALGWGSRASRRRAAPQPLLPRVTEPRAVTPHRP